MRLEENLSRVRTCLSTHTWWDRAPWSWVKFVCQPASIKYIFSQFFLFYLVGKCNKTLDDWPTGNSEFCFFSTLNARTLTISLKCALSRAVQSSLSLCSLNGSKLYLTIKVWHQSCSKQRHGLKRLLYLTVPTNSTGSWGMTDILDRRSSRPAIKRV